jgi:hypothetical protein
MLGAVKVLTARVDGLEKIQNHHMSECAELARENLRRSDEIIRRSDENARACISTAEAVRDAMQKTMFRVAGAIIAILLTAMGGIMALAFQLLLRGRT